MHYSEIKKTLQNPEIFQINRQSARCTLTKWYSDKKEIKFDDSTLKTSLNGEWSFNYVENEATRSEAFINDITKLTSFITVPSSIEFNGYGSIQYVNHQYPWDGVQGIEVPSIPANQFGQYGKKIKIDPKYMTKDIIINFDGVECAFNLWVNGNYVGYAEDSHTISRFNISKFIDFSKENYIAVEVYKFSSASWLEDQDFWRLFGIHRNVYLTYEDLRSFNDVAVSFDFSNSYKDVKAKFIFDNEVDDLEIDVYDECGTIVATTSRSTKTNEVGLPMTDVKLWSAEKPHLYTAIISDGVNYAKLTFGIREFKLIDGIMCLNGKRIIFNGVNRHEFSATNARSQTINEIERDLKLLKQNNFNAIRCSHYPNQNVFYELCDKYGFYVIDETNLETHGTWFNREDDPDRTGLVPCDDKSWQECINDRSNSMIETHKNHASILIWSCGNESFGGEVLFNQSNFIREKDPSRLVHYEGIFWDMRYPDTTDMISYMYLTAQEIASVIEEGCSKPIISCEYTHAMGNSNGQVGKYIDLIDKYPQYQGGFVWEYKDHGILETSSGAKKFLYGGDFEDRPTDYNFVFDGLVKSDYSNTAKLQELKYWYQPFKFLFEDGLVKITNKLLFTNLNEYRVNVTYYVDGIKQNSITSNFNCGPQEAVHIPICIEYATKGENYIIVSIFDVHNNEVAFDQFIYVQDEVVEIQAAKPINVVDAKYNIGVHGENFQIMFAKAKGSLISIKYNGVELLTFPNKLPQATFWRAPTDNDTWTGTANQLVKWKAESKYFSLESLSYEVKNDHVEIKAAQKTFSGREIFTNYTINSCGDIKVSQTVDLGDEASFGAGFTFCIPKQFNNVKWYGYGPQETYCDRYKGAKLGINNECIYDLETYTMPQDFGNHFGTRWFEITDNFKTSGLKITSSVPFDFSATPYVPEELEICENEFDLPNVNKTCLTLFDKKTGIGGDNSWSKWVHDEDIVNGTRTLNFTISKIK